MPVLVRVTRTRRTYKPRHDSALTMSGPLDSVTGHGVLPVVCCAREIGKESSD